MNKLDEPGSPPQERCVFISYGRQDASEFASRLAKDLNEQGGHHTWFDRESIGAAARWDVIIESGIRDCTVVAAIMTPHSVAPRSICRDEIVYAINQHKTVVPLLADSGTKPTLLLTRLNWIDFSQDYQQGLQVLLDYLAGRPDALQDPILPTVTGEVPLDFSPEIARHSTLLTGREWFLDELDARLEHSKRPMVVVAGEPGIGKSALAAWLCRVRQQQVVGIHFCTDRNSETLCARRFVASLVAQLCDQLPGYEEEVRMREPQVRRKSASDAFRQLIAEPVRKIRFENSDRQPALLIIDALDESLVEQGESILEVLDAQVDDLPEWMRVVVTTRPEPAVLERVTRQPVLELTAEDPQNEEDLRDYIRTRLASPEFAARVTEGPDSLEEQLANLAAGNFLCAAMLLDELQEPGGLNANDLRSLSGGLSDFYHQSFGKRFPDLPTFRSRHALLLDVIAAARAPVTLKLLCHALGQAEDDVRDAIRDLRVFLRRTGHGEAAYLPFHRSLTDWLSDERLAGQYYRKLGRGEPSLAEACWQECLGPPESLSEYSYRNLSVHLGRLCRWDELLHAVRNPQLDLIARWVEKGEGDDGIACLRGLIGYLNDEGRDRITAAGLATQLARIYSAQGRYDDARSCLRAHAIAATSWIRGRRAHAIALHELGSLELYRSNLDAAERAFRKAYRYSKFGWPIHRDEAAANLVGLATVASDRQAFQSVLSLTQRAGRQASAAGDYRHMIAAERLSAHALKHLGQLDEAARRIDVGLKLTELFQFDIEKASLLNVQGWLKYDSAIFHDESPAAAEESFQQSLATSQRIHSLFGLLDAKLGIAWTHLSAGRYDDARQYILELQATIRQGEHRILTAGTQTGQAALCQATGDLDKAHALYEEAVTFCKTENVSVWGARAVVGLLSVELGRCDEKRANELVEQALQFAASVSSFRVRLTEINLERTRSFSWPIPR